MGAAASVDGCDASSIAAASVEDLKAVALTADAKQKLVAALLSDDSWRRELLADLFRACDDDNSGALSRDEFQQVFSKADDTTSQMFGGILFGQADASGDGRLTCEEFVELFLEKLASDAEAFRAACAKMIDVAKSAVVIDTEAAVAEQGAAKSSPSKAGAKAFQRATQLEKDQYSPIGPNRGQEFLVCLLIQILFCFGGTDSHFEIFYFLD